MFGVFRRWLNIDLPRVMPGMECFVVSNFQRMCTVVAFFLVVLLLLLILDWAGFLACGVTMALRTMAY